MLVACQSQAKGLDRQDKLISTPSRAHNMQAGWRHTGRVARMAPSWDSSFLHGKSLLLCCTPSCPSVLPSLSPQEKRKKPIEEPGCFPCPTPSPAPIFQHMDEATPEYSPSKSISHPLKSQEVIHPTGSLPSHHHCSGPATLAVTAWVSTWQRLLSQGREHVQPPCSSKSDPLLFVERGHQQAVNLL